MTEEYLSAEDWQTAAIREAVEAVDADPAPIEHADVATWLRSWGTENELPPPLAPKQRLRLAPEAVADVEGDEG